MATRNTPSDRLLRTIPLDALRGFEAAARLLSFTLAADELSLTQSAISKQVKGIEELIGRPLFVRGPRGLGLTTEGRRLHEGVHRALLELRQALDALAGQTRQTVSLTATPSFASLWLAPRLAMLREREPSLDVHVDASEARLDIERHGIDLAVRLVDAGDEDLAGRVLVRERLMLVAAPSLAERVRSAADLARMPLLVFQHPVERFGWMSWSHWFEHLGLPKPAGQPVCQFTQYEHAVKAAVEGAGVMIGRTPLVMPALRAGQLQVVLPGEQHEGMGYRLVVSGQALARPEVLRVADWIGQELAEEALG